MAESVLNVLDGTTSAGRLRSSATLVGYTARNGTGLSVKTSPDKHVFTQLQVNIYSHGLTG
ncbi:hypothetical protein DPMN_001830 [Dreissena polymorpha]|uniref:Uncharacterized protein n=1 Tax=Dreissena polymorpha TaxID=45954 RepID=A0A9D4RT94_DREPO|nr:hypothetical protein DPMN_001830 [Dreissena polymorpha]